MPTSQKSSLNSHMNLTRRENAGVFPLMGLTRHRQSNAIHELSGSGGRLRTQMFATLNFCTNSTYYSASPCSLLALFFFFLPSPRDSLTSIVDGAQRQSVCQMYCILQICLNYLRKMASLVEGKMGHVTASTEPISLRQQWSSLQ